MGNHEVECPYCGVDLRYILSHECAGTRKEYEERKKRLEREAKLNPITKEIADRITACYTLGVQSRDDEVRELKAQNAVLRKALEYYRCGDNCVCGNPQRDGKSVCGHVANEALSLTPSDAAEIVRKKTVDILRLGVDTCFGVTYEGCNGECCEAGEDVALREHALILAIEAARAAGVEVEG